MSAEEKKILSKKLIFEALRNYGALFNKAPNDQALDLYADMLSEHFEFKQVTWALSEFIKGGSAFYPSCGEIFSLLKPAQPKKEDKAPMVANELIQFVRLHHYDLEKNYLHTLSPLAQFALKHLGDTRTIRNSENFETMRAQLERYVKGILATKEANEKADKLESIGINNGRVLDFPFRTMDYSNFLPNETEET